MGLAYIKGWLSSSCLGWHKTPVFWGGVHVVQMEQLEANWTPDRLQMDSGQKIGWVVTKEKLSKLQVESTWNMWGSVKSSSLRWCERQLGHDVKTNDGLMAICQVISILHLYPHVYTQGVTNCRSEKWTTNFCSLWKWTYQDTTKFCSLKDQEYYIPEKQTTNFCSLKKRTLPSFVVSKIKTIYKSCLFSLWGGTLCKDVQLACPMYSNTPRPELYLCWGIIIPILVHSPQVPPML